MKEEVDFKVMSLLYFLVFYDAMLDFTKSTDRR